MAVSTISREFCDQHHRHERRRDHHLHHQPCKTKRPINLQDEQQRQETSESIPTLVRQLDISRGAQTHQRARRSLVSSPLKQNYKLVLMPLCVFVLVSMLVTDQLATLSQAYPSGAPEQACKDLKPGHGVEAQSGASPFELSQDKLQVGAGDQIKVTLNSPSGTNFKGLIVQAVNEAGEPKGKFLPGAGLKAIDSCSAVTHSDKEAKKTATLIWQAPDDLKAKEAIVFKATVVKKFDEIYTNIKSSLK